MHHSLSDRVAQLGLNLPQPGQPIANYVNYVISQNQLFISGQIPLQDGKPAFIGRLGDSLDETQGAQAAELAALGLLAQLGHALEDDLSHLVRIVRLGVFVASSADSNARAPWPTAPPICWSMPSATKVAMHGPPSVSPACPAVLPWKSTRFSSCGHERSAG